MAQRKPTQGPAAGMKWIVMARLRQSTDETEKVADTTFVADAT